MKESFVKTDFELVPETLRCENSLTRVKRGFENINFPKNVICEATTFPAIERSLYKIKDNGLKNQIFALNRHSVIIV